MKNFTYDINNSTITVEIEGCFDVDLSHEWITWGDFNEYSTVQHDSIRRYIQQHFGHLWSEKANTFNALAGFKVELEDYDFDFRKLEVELEVTLLNDLEDEYLEDCEQVTTRIINSINIDEESWYEVQEEQFDWWLENGVSGEDNMLARKMIDYGYVLDYVTNGKYSCDTVPIDSVDQSVVDRFVQEQINMWNLDADEIAEIKEALEDVDLEFNYKPQLEEAA